MTKAVNELQDLETQIEKLALTMMEISESQGDVQEFIKNKREAESLIDKLPKERKTHWTARLKMIKKPRKMSSAERQKLQMSKVVSSVKSPTHALALGVGQPVKEETSFNMTAVEPEKIPGAYADTNTESHINETPDISQDMVSPKADTEIKKDEKTVKTNKEIDALPAIQGEKAVTPILEEPLTPSISETGTETISSTDIEGSKKKRLAKLRAKTKKVRVEDTHTRKTYLVRNDLLERIEQVSNGTHGFKIEFINFAIELALAEYEQEGEGESE